MKYSVICEWNKSTGWYSIMTQIMRTMRTFFDIVSLWCVCVWPMTGAHVPIDSNMFALRAWNELDRFTPQDKLEDTLLWFAFWLFTLLYVYQLYPLVSLAIMFGDIPSLINIIWYLIVFLLMHTVHLCYNNHSWLDQACDPGMLSKNRRNTSKNMTPDALNRGAVLRPDHLLFLCLETRGKPCWLQHRTQGA